jgi:four helix bundle protein
LGEVRSQVAAQEAVMFQVAELSFELIEELRPLVSRVRARDRALADPLMRAASSIALNIEEGRGSDSGNQRARFFTASGSAKETRAALCVAVGWRHIQAVEAEGARQLLDRIAAMLWKLTHR